MDFTKYEVTLSYPTTSHGYDKEELKRKRKEFYDEVCAKEKAFETDLIDWYGLPDNIITRKLVSMAWEDGHAYGYSEVENAFADYANLYEFVVKHKDELK